MITKSENADKLLTTSFWMCLYNEHLQ